MLEINKFSFLITKSLPLIIIQQSITLSEVFRRKYHSCSRKVFISAKMWISFVNVSQSITHNVIFSTEIDKVEISSINFSSIFQSMNRLQISWSYLEKTWNKSFFLLVWIICVSAVCFQLKMTKKIYCNVITSFCAKLSGRLQSRKNGSIALVRIPDVRIDNIFINN